MSDEPLPAGLERATAAVRRATAELIRSAGVGADNGIDLAIEARGEAVEALLAELAREQDALDPELRRRIVREIALQAGDAESALRRLMTSNRALLAAIARSSQAMRGYATHSRDSEALDRSG